MRTSSLTGIAAGMTLLTLSASAQDKALDPIPVTNDVGIASPECLIDGTPGLAMRAIGTPGIYGAVYDNLTTPGSNFTFGYSMAPHFGDDVSLVPGKQSAFQPQLITGMNVVIDIQDTQGVFRTFDVAVKFWDTQEGGPNGQAYKDFLVGFRATINLPGGVWILPFDFSGLPGGGLQLTDGGFCFDIGFYKRGTTQYINASGTTVICVLRSQGTYSTNGLPTTLNGFSLPWVYFDPNGGGVCTSILRATDFTLLSSLACQFFGDVRCAADFNNDGFVDPLDYNTFINVFESGGGCP